MDYREIKGVEETWPLNKIVVNNFVRAELDHGHVLYLKSLVEAGENLRRIIINRGGILIDGRHRCNAYKLLNKRQVDVKVVNITDEAEIIALAYKLNCGGSKPPTPRDTELTVISLLNLGVPKREIAGNLAIPLGMAMRYITNVQSRQTSAKLRKASDAVIEGAMSLPAAAQKHGVPKEKLQGYLKAAREKKRDIGQVRSKLTSEGMSYMKVVTTIIKQAITMWEEGEIQDGHLNEVITQVERLNKSQASAISEYRQRINRRIAEGIQGQERKNITLVKSS